MPPGMLGNHVPPLIRPTGPEPPSKCWTLPAAEPGPRMVLDLSSCEDLISRPCFVLGAPHPSPPGLRSRAWYPSPPGPRRRGQQQAAQRMNRRSDATAAAGPSPCRTHQCWTHPAEDRTHPVLDTSSSWPHPAPARARCGTHPAQANPSYCVTGRRLLATLDQTAGAGLCQLRAHPRPTVPAFIA